MSHPQFSHQKLVVYQRAIEFVAWVTETIEDLLRSSVRDQMDRASIINLPLNIAEENIKAPGRDRCRYWQIALGLAVECSAWLAVAVARQFLPKGQMTMEIPCSPKPSKC